MSDKFGYKRGARGYGELTEMDREFLRPDFDRKRQVGELAVGQRAWVGSRPGHKQKVAPALEGDDC